MTYRDLSWVNGDFVLDASGDLQLDSGGQVVRTDLLARLGSPRDSHWAWPGEGTDLQRFVNSIADELTLLELRQDVELEVLKDVRVLDVTALVATPDLKTGQISVTAELTDDALVQLGLPTLIVLRGGDSP